MMRASVDGAPTATTPHGTMTAAGGRSPGVGTMQTKHLHRVIADVVAENTASQGQGEAARKLVKYLSNPQTIDIVYEKIIERVSTSKSQNQQVLTLTVKLLKTHLTQHVPSKEALHKLDQFCISIKSENPTISKSIQFIRNLIKKQLSPLSKLGGSGGGDSKPLAVVSISGTKHELVNNPKSPVVEKLAHGHGRSQSLQGKRNGTLTGKEGESEPSAKTPGDSKLLGSGENKAAADNSQELIADFLALNASHCDATLPIEDVSLASTSVFGGQFRRLSTSATTKGKPIYERLNNRNLDFHSQLAASDVSDDLRIHDSESVRNHIQTVALAKKQEEQHLYKQAGLVTLRRKGVQLFQYIYYKDQLPLSLPPDEMEQVINSVVSSPQEDHESCLIASKILIKLLVDMYCTDGDAASRLLLSLLFEMLDSTQTHTKVHAFNLLWNLSIHMNLLEEIEVIPEEGGEAGRNTDAYKRIQAIQEDLFAVVKEMLLHLYHRSEHEEKVWSAALNCTLFFITNQGHIERHKLSSLDPRILPTMISHIETLSDEMYRQLMRCFINILHTDKQELNIKLLIRACPGGISWIIHHYTRCRSDVVRGNLFSVIFHYILYKLKRTKKQKTAMILQLLTSVHAPLYFTQLFKLPPPNFVKDFMAFMQDQLHIAPSFVSSNTPASSSPSSSATTSASSSAANSTATTPPNTPHQYTPPASPSSSFSASFTPTTNSGSSNATASVQAASASAASLLSPGTTSGNTSGNNSASSLPVTLSVAAISKLVETKLLEMVLVGFHKLATEHLKLESQYASKLHELVKLDSPRMLNVHVKSLTDLLNSSNTNERWQGELWLYELLQIMEIKKSPVSEPLQTSVRNVFNTLLASTDPKVRRIYSSITERLLLSMKSQLREPMKETGLTEVFKILNENFERVVASGEKDVANLLFMLDILFNVLTYRTDLASTSTHTEEEMYLDKGGDQYNEFLCGRISVSHQLLKRIDINILVYLSIHLPRSNLINSINDAKVTTLIMIIHKCTKENEALEAIGGVSFFKKLLVETNPQIAYHASRFIIEQLRRERPEQYQAIFKQLLQRAQVTKDDKLLSNYYLQVISIIEMNNQHNKALGTTRRASRAPPLAAAGLTTTRKG